MENCLPILCESVKVLVAQLCLTLYDPKNCSHLPPLSMEFFRQKYWSGLSFPSLEDLPNLGIEPESLVSLHWQAGSLPLHFSVHGIFQARILEWFAIPFCTGSS